MEAQLFLKGLIIGISIAAPVGPIGVLCIRATLAKGAIHGLVAGLGAATADAIYGFTAAFGLTWISNVIVAQQFWFRLIGGGFLGYLGIKTLLAPPSKDVASGHRYHHIGAYGTTFFLTLTNPMTILSFAAIFGGLGMVNPSAHYASASLMVVGVFIGSGLWWCFLSGFTGMFRERFIHKKLSWVNRVSGIIITTFGVLALISIAV